MDTDRIEALRALVRGVALKTGWELRVESRGGSNPVLWAKSPKLVGSKALIELPIVLGEESYTACDIKALMVEALDNAHLLQKIHLNNVFL